MASFALVDVDEDDDEHRHVGAEIDPAMTLSVVISRFLRSVFESLRFLFLSKIIL